MKLKTVIVLTIFIIGSLLISACTNTNGSSSSTPVSTPPQKVDPITPVTIITIQTTEPQTTATVINQSTIVATTTATTDPILHRYIRINKDLSGYEFTFYPNGDLNYRAGTTKRVSDDYLIDRVQTQASGTWTALGNNKYLVKFLPVGVSGAEIVREYTLVPSHKDPDYGFIIAEYIKSSYESDAMNKGERIQLDQMFRYYPQRAKID